MDKGALYYLIQNIAGCGQVIAYYDTSRKLIATQKAGIGAPTASPVLSKSNPVGYLEAEFAVSEAVPRLIMCPLQSHRERQAYNLISVWRIAVNRAKGLRV